MADRRMKVSLLLFVCVSVSFRDGQGTVPDSVTLVDVTNDRSAVWLSVMASVNNNENQG